MLLLTVMDRSEQGAKVLVPHAAATGGSSGTLAALLPFWMKRSAGPM